MEGAATPVACNPPIGQRKTTRGETDMSPSARLSVLAALLVGTSMLQLGCGGPAAEEPTDVAQPTEALSPGPTMTEPKVTEAKPTRRPPTTRPTAQPTLASTATASPTPFPPTVPPTLTSSPTVPRPTPVPEKFLSLNPDQDRDCDEFDSYAEAQAYWNYHRNPSRPNPGGLDGNGNGVVCEEADRQAPPPPQPLVGQPPSGCVNINTASFEDLKRIIHVDDDRANQIIHLRPFRSVDDLIRVKGIGKKRLEDIKAQGLACVY